MELAAATRASEPSGDRLFETVAAVMAGCDLAESSLYRHLSRTFRPFFISQLGGQHADDLVPDLFLIVLKSIRARRLREPECLNAYAYAIAQRLVVRTIQRISVARQRERPSNELLSDRQESPELACQRNETAGLMRAIFSAMSASEREILRRFYLEEEPADQIRSEMGLSPNQFRLAKWRAKERFGVLGKQLLRAPIVPGAMRYRAGRVSRFPTAAALAPPC